MSAGGFVRATAGRIAERTPADRDRYADLVRVVAILVVVYGHWTAAVVFVDQELVAAQLLVVEPWTRLATWVVQVMPLFFLVGGLVNAGSLIRSRARHEPATAWTRRRARRLLRPLLPLLVVWVATGPALATLGVRADLVELAAETAFLPVWFLVVYLLVIALAPLAWCLHRRFGWAPVIAGVASVAVVDALHRIGTPIVGEANYLLVFGVVHQLGFLWFDGRLPSGRRALHLTWVGVLVALLLVRLLGYPVSMVGLQARADSNATPPTLALLALAVAQLGLVLALRAPVARWLHRHPVPWAAVAGLGSVIITTFLWHMTALIVVASLTHLAGLWPDVSMVGVRWWALRPPWLLLCTLALAPLVALFRGFEGSEAPRGGHPAATVPGVLAVAGGLYVLLTEGVYAVDRPVGAPAAGVALLVAGLLLLGVHRPAAGAGP